MHKINIFFLINLFTLSIYSKYDLTIVGMVKYADSLSRLSIGWIDHTNELIKINYINSRPKIQNDFNDVSTKVRKIIENKDKSAGNVALFLDLLWDASWNASNMVPNSKIKLAYSMLEATQIPSQWVNILNNKFDAVVVPDNFLIDVYKNSGVKIPIFVLPCGLYLDDFLNLPIKNQKNRKFIFGNSAVLCDRKNQKLLIKAFASEFGNNSDVILLLHSRVGDNKYISEVENLIKQLRLNNIFLIKKSFNHQEYLKFLQSLDCYVFVTKGEGFSITPREAMACGIPCILSNNFAHKTICDTNLVSSVNANIKEPAIYDVFNMQCGLQYNSSTEDVRRSLRDVYQNYDRYLLKSEESRNWVKQYTYPNLTKKFISLVKPKKIIYGETNLIDDNFLMTSSKKLYEKYLETFKNI